MSLRDDIAKLPKHGEPRLYPHQHIGGAVTESGYWEHEAHCYLARLELLREWASDAHKDHCSAMSYGGVTKPNRCDCGRDAMLAATEPKP